MIIYEIEAWKRRIIDRYNRFRQSKTADYVIGALYLSGTALILGLTRAIRVAMDHN